MDTTDTEIIFDNQGICNHCRKYETEKKRIFPGDEGRKQLNTIAQRMKLDGVGRDYDCILGLSGGLDSSYAAILLKEYGLRVLAVHIDAGWNSNVAVSNIEKVVRYCNFDLLTHVMDWLEIRDLQLAYLNAGVANQDVVQDHAFFSNLYRISTERKIKYVVNGGNYATESVFPASWHHSAMDGINIKSIHKKYGKRPLKKYKIMSIYDYYIRYPYISRLKNVRPLNYVDYNKSEALEKLIKLVDYTPYARKHGESRFTRFFQNYYLPTKFGFDKRRPHLSSMILAGHISRETALLELEKPLYNQFDLNRDIADVADKLGISSGDILQYMKIENRHYTDFENWDKYYFFLKKIQKIIEAIRGKKFAKYS